MAHGSDLLWSPDGRRLAWVEALVEPSPASGWIWTNPAGKPVPTARSGSWRIWVTDRAGVSRLLARGAEPVALLAWQPAGESLAWLRGKSTSDAIECELVIHDGTREKCQGGWRLSQETAIEHATGSWSPSGTRLAISVAESLRIWSVPEARPLAEFSQASRPVFSPTADVLAFYRHVPEGELVVCREPFQKVSFLIATEATWQAPQWGSDGTAIVALRARQLPNERGETRSVARGTPAWREGNWDAGLVRVSLANGAVEPLFQLTEGRRAALPQGLWFAWAAPRLLHLAPAEAGRPFVLESLDPTQGHAPRRWHPLAPRVPMDGLSLSPDGGQLALRFGPADRGVLLVADMNSPRRTLPVGDAHTRATALLRLAEVCDRALWQRGEPHEKSVSWASRIPTARQLKALPENIRRTLDSVIGLARPLLARSATGEDGSPGEPAQQRAMEELSLFFDALAEDWPQVAERLKRLDQHELTAEERFRQMTVRAICLLAEGRPAAARGLLEDLDRRLERFERTEPGGQRRGEEIRATLETLHLDATSGRP